MTTQATTEQLVTTLVIVGLVIVTKSLIVIGRGLKTWGPMILQFTGYDKKINSWFGATIAQVASSTSDTAGTLSTSAGPGRGSTILGSIATQIKTGGRRKIGNVALTPEDLKT